ncbi:DUF4232 domain-containing protein [Streptomyces sp. NPDC001904]|uniref:DUF4232 domain-containing protein n=1 Tax=Streptomyces sp. NPDC001904 TaxID=3154531 RepID=UPI00332286D1
MMIRGRAVLTRAAGFTAAALLVTGCGTQTSGDAAPAGPAASPSSSGTDLGRVHLDKLDPSAPQYGTVRTAPPTTAAPTGPCPGSGVRITAGAADAALGLRALRLTLTNCGTGTVALSGYPRLRLAESDGTPIESVRVLRGTRQVTDAVADPGPHRLTLRRGESAISVLAWRNTYADTTNPPVTVDRVTVDPGIAGAARTVTPEPPLDLGSTGRLGTTAWHER